MQKPSLVEYPSIVAKFMAFLLNLIIIRVKSEQLKENYEKHRKYAYHVRITLLK